MSSALSSGLAALVVAHPGHELQVFGWMERTRPKVFVLTDGSGRMDRSRLASTTRILDETGATSGAIYGSFTDRKIYDAIIQQDHALFIGLTETLVAELLRGGFAYVVGDAIEGYNPTHDVCRLMINAAVEIVNREEGREIGNYDFLLLGSAKEYVEKFRSSAIWHFLDQEALERKLSAARAYTELTSEVDATISKIGIPGMQLECLRPVTDPAGKIELLEEPPFYESYGEKQVGAGYYQQVLRYRQHIKPLAEALRRQVEGKENN